LVNINAAMKTITMVPSSVNIVSAI
jgi:hypothetical protein